MGRLIALVPVGLVLGATLAGGAAAQDLRELATTISLGGRYVSGAETSGDFEIGANLSLLDFSTRGSDFRAYGIDLEYAAGSYLTIASVIPRIERAFLGGMSVHGSDMAVASVSYLALGAGYGWGTVWDNTYFDIYGTNEDVEIEVSGIPFEGAVGYRRLGVGGFTLQVEAVAGLFLVTSAAAEDSRGSAPSLMPSIGVRFGFGYSTFSYQWVR